METRTKRLIINTLELLVVCILWGSCVEPFDVGPVEYRDALVVEGIITNETKQHQVRLSRTSALNDVKFIPEGGATVVLKESTGSSTTLTEFSPGIYKTPYMTGVVGTTYSLFITTSNGNKYASEDVTMKNSPPIDKMYAQYSVDNPNQGPGIQIYLDTKDINNATHYYRWEYEGTYEIRTPYPSKFVWTGGNTITIRTVQVDNCWATDSSKSVLIQSSTGLDEDKVTGFPIKFIPAESPDLVIKYSLLAKQYAMSENAYRFWKALKEINEKQGTLSDKQPGKVRGNITSVSGTGSVLGYFDASGVSTKRAFFTPRQFAESGYTPPLYLQSCVETEPITIPIGKLAETMKEYSNTLIIADAGGEGPSVVFLLRIACCDCTARGTNLKPSFWE